MTDDEPIPYELCDPPTRWMALEDIAQAATERTYRT